MPNEAGFLTDVAGTPISATNTLPVGATVTVNPPTSTTGTMTTVAIANTSTTVLASNASRKGATIYADGTLPTNLYIALSATAASSTAYTVQLSSSLPYYEVPFGYTGQINHIGSSATGNLRVTELT